MSIYIHMKKKKKKNGSLGSIASTEPAGVVAGDDLPEDHVLAIQVGGGLSATGERLPTRPKDVKQIRSKVKSLELGFASAKEGTWNELLNAKSPGLGTSKEGQGRKRTGTPKGRDLELRGLIKRSVIHGMTIGWKTTQQMISWKSYPWSFGGRTES